MIFPKISLPVLVFACLSAAQAADAPLTAPDPENGRVLFGNMENPGKICFTCHGAEGNGLITDGVPDLPTQPRLAQQHPEYIVKQLTEFKSGLRDNITMQPMADQLTDQEMLDVAAWLSQQKRTSLKARDAAAVAEGEKIYRGGIRDRNIPACIGCHGPTGAGIPSQYPRLAGQFFEYTEAQLKTFRDGTRNNNNIMTDISAKMNDKEIKAVSEYIAGLR